MAVSNPAAEPDAVLGRVEKMLRQLDTRLSTVAETVSDVAHDVRNLHSRSDVIAKELEGVEGMLEQLRATELAGASAGPYERCQECGGAVHYVEAQAGWSTSCQLCHWTDYQEDPAHAHPPVNLAIRDF